MAAELETVESRFDRDYLQRRDDREDRDIRQRRDDRTARAYVNPRTGVSATGETSEYVEELFD